MQTCIQLYYHRKHIFFWTCFGSHFLQTPFLLLPFLQCNPTIKVQEKNGEKKLDTSVCVWQTEREGNQRRHPWFTNLTILYLLEKKELETSTIPIFIYIPLYFRLSEDENSIPFSNFTSARWAMHYCVSTSLIDDCYLHFGIKNVLKCL